MIDRVRLWRLQLGALDRAAFSRSAARRNFTVDDLRVVMKGIE